MRRRRKLGARARRRGRGIVAGATVASALGFGIGCWVQPAFPIAGWENNDVACSDGVDNDADGTTDCEDLDCLANSHLCGEIVPPFPYEEAEVGCYPPVGMSGEPLAPYPGDTKLQSCRDQIDNDNNGQFDCGDPACREVPETCCLREATDAACVDGLDNDNNGFIDCEDFGCRNGTFVSVCDEDLPFTCDDGLDNDGDGDVDCEDSDCEGLSPCVGDCIAGEEVSLEACSDGCDNDNNGFVDCQDFSCSMSMDPAVLDYCGSFASEDTLDACSNGIDDDMNGFTDCEDFSCSMSLDPEVVDYCAQMPSEDTLDACSNGVDDDENGYTDCGDFSCSQSEDPDIQAYCADQLETTYERCTDCIDNDGNGYTDCGDFSCADAQAEDGSYACRESGTRDVTAEEYDCDESSCAAGLQQLVLTNAALFCGDGKDNDRDGFIDCEDFDCAMDPVANPSLNIGELCRAMFPAALDGAVTVPTACVTAGATSWSGCATACESGAFDVCGARMCGL